MAEQRRFLFYSHDGVGLGHVRRNLSIARALTEFVPNASVLLATSVDEVDRLGVPKNVDVLKLPGLRKAADGSYVARHLGIVPRDVRALRSALLTAAVESFRPAVVLVDKHPLGASGEFRDALEAAREAGGRAVLGLRDILDSPATVKAEWSEYSLHDRIVEYYDRVLVYGQPVVLDSVQEYGFSDAVARMTHFCGYVVDHPGNGLNGRQAASVRPRPLVIATTGGGEDGGALLGAVIEASVGASWDALVVAGPQCDSTDTTRLEQASAMAGVEFRTFVSGLSATFSSASALVCMGGYNTLLEAVASGVPTLCVPRTAPRQEQLIRANAFARLGLLSVLDPSELTVASLREQIDETVGRARTEPRDRVLDLRGARRAAHHLLELATDHRAVKTRHSQAARAGGRREALRASG